VLEAFVDRPIRPEVVALVLPYAADELVRGRRDLRSVPAGGLDAEKVVRTVAADQAPAPAGLKRGLRDQRLCLHPELGGRALRMRPDRPYERLGTAGIEPGVRVGGA